MIMLTVLEVVSRHAVVVNVVVLSHARLGVNDKNIVFSSVLRNFFTCITAMPRRAIVMLKIHLIADIAESKFNFSNLKVELNQAGSKILM
jgi:uncharacterized protein YsxB (DUF464 family)